MNKGLVILVLLGALSVQAAEGYVFHGNRLQIKRLEVYSAKSIWNKGK